MNAARIASIVFNTRRAARTLFITSTALTALAACGPAETQTAATTGTAVSAPTVVVVQGGGSSGGSAQSTAQSGVVASGGEGGAQMQPRGRLGHYSNNDGTVGFVFDRTSTPPLVRIDGSNAVVPLTTRPGPLDSTEFVNSEQHVWIRVGDYGQVLFDGPEQHEGINVYRDADANPLH